MQNKWGFVRKAVKVGGEMGSWLEIQVTPHQRCATRTPVEAAVGTNGVVGAAVAKGSSVVAVGPGDVAACSEVGQNGDGGSAQRRGERTQDRQQQANPCAVSNNETHNSASRTHMSPCRVTSMRLHRGSPHWSASALK